MKLYHNYYIDIYQEPEPQGKALLDAKKLICGDEWNVKQLTHKTSKKWKEFLKMLDLIDKNGNQKVNVNYLLDFAGYKEAEQNYYIIKYRVNYIIYDIILSVHLWICTKAFYNTL